MKVKVKVKSSSAYDCCRKNIYIFRIIRGTGMWDIGIPKKGVLKVKGKIGLFPAPVNLKQYWQNFQTYCMCRIQPAGEDHVLEIFLHVWFCQFLDPMREERRRERYSSSFPLLHPKDMRFCPHGCNTYILPAS